MKGWPILLFSTYAMAYLVARNDTSGNKSCEGTPFSCPSDRTCIITTPDNSTVLCCPIGSKCTSVEPIDCDIQQQNATLYPTSALFTTELDATLPSCAGKCCPLGYSCDNYRCKLDSASPTSSAGPSATATPTSTSSPVVVPITPVNDSDSGSNTSQTHSNPFPPGAVILGLFLGLMIGAAATFFVFWFLRRRKQRKVLALPSPDFLGKTPPTTRPESPKGTPSRSKHAPKGSASSTVSEPMWLSTFDGAHRTDFLRRGSFGHPTSANLQMANSAPGDSKTGYEHQVKPSWSSNDSGTSTVNGEKAKIEQATPVTLQRGQSKRINGANLEAPKPDTTNPYTPPNQTGSANLRNPMFDATHRFGLPISPSPAPRNKSKPERPARSDEFVPTMSGGLSSANTRTRDDSQRRPLVQHDVLGRAQDDQNRQNLQRSDSVESSSSIDSNASMDSAKQALSSKKSSGEVMTIHLDTPGAPSPATYLAPPAPLFSTTDDRGRPQTTFTDLMVKAGWKETDGWERRQK
ncbi:hypothetical protein FH972_021412 [Carpinus fangiana]|uniref:Uncharacterized protein n=1 Tax=Carpinus fangiana TaxID=176857 RepID=A0A5N6KP97_9ROSI|nr:hypothetical protein FH972_021412 [Carpinus fangiana]